MRRMAYNLMKKGLFWFIVSLILFVYVAKAGARPAVYSDYYCLIDSESGQIIVSKNADKMRPMASTTKMMTAILVEEYCNLDEMAVVSYNAARTPEFTIGLRQGQKIEVGELLKPLLIRSSNDAAVVLAEHVAGEERLFAHLMTKKAFLLGAFHTHFVNSSGLPASNHFSTAYDLALIGRYLLSKKVSSELVATKVAKFKHPGYREPISITNTNGLLGAYEGVNGIKTGTTDAAGKCLVASAKRNGRGLIAVVLKSGDRTGDCRRLLEYGYNNTRKVKIIDQATPFKQLKVADGAQTYVDVYPKNEISLWIGDNTPYIEKKVELKYNLTAPVIMGEKIGRLTVYADGKPVTSVDLICGETVKKRSNLVEKLYREWLN